MAAKSENVTVYLCLVYLCIVTILLLFIVSFFISFTDWNIIGVPKYVGFLNFVAPIPNLLLTNPEIPPLFVKVLKVFFDFV